MKQQEFLQIISPFKDKIFRVAKRLLVSIEEAEDATQEVLVRLWNKNEGLQKYNSVEALAMTMTKLLFRPIKIEKGIKFAIST